jgi:hypothetical protein
MLGSDLNISHPFLRLSRQGDVTLMSEELLLWLMPGPKGLLKSENATLNFNQGRKTNDR